MTSQTALDTRDATSRRVRLRAARGLPGRLLARGYHVLQLPFVSRRSRVGADWALAAAFRRDVAEPSPTPTGGSA
jgi:hypothetical protein